VGKAPSRRIIKIISRIVPSMLDATFAVANIGVENASGAAGFTRYAYIVGRHLAAAGSLV
jgi:hypothetical protein